MDCSTCRGLFSASFDGRLVGERRQEFIIHVQGCAPCESEFALYRRVFSTIRGLPDGDAPPFRVPAEVPGSLSTANRFSSRPRFARVAAGILLLIGLVGTHALVFEWSRQNASTSSSVPSSSGGTSGVSVLKADPVALLPASLRDHVEATDLFIKTAAQAAQLPGETGAQELAEADWACSNLARLTSDLRSKNYDVPERAQIESYLRRSEDFVNRTRSIIDGKCRGSCVQAICDAAADSKVAQDLDSMKPIVVALPLGTSFAGMPDPPAFGKLRPDSRELLQAKHARLSGQLGRALEQLNSFEVRYKGSRFSPVARYLILDTLMASRRYVDACVMANGDRMFPGEWVKGLNAGVQLAKGRMVVTVNCNGIAKVQWEFLDPQAQQYLPMKTPQPAPNAVQPVTVDPPAPK